MGAMKSLLLGFVVMLAGCSGQTEEVRRSRLAEKEELERAARQGEASAKDIETMQDALGQRDHPELRKQLEGLRKMAKDARERADAFKP